MRIALIAHADAPWTPRYARSFQSAGNEVTVYSFEATSIPGVRTVPLGGSREPGRLARRDYLLAVPRLRRWLREAAPDVVLATYLMSNGVVAALAWRGPIVVSARGGDVLDQAGNLPLPGILRRYLIRFACRRAHRVHAVSDEIGDALRAAGVGAERIVTFPIGVDLERFRPRPEPRDEARPTHLLCTRRHAPVYRNDLILEAMARLDGDLRMLRLTFIGDGPLLEERRRQAAALGIADRVSFIPQVAYERMPEFLREADIYISASASDGTSSSLLEALAVGLLPVVTRIRANLSWVRDGDNGFLFTEGDAGDLAAALRRAAAGGPMARRAWVENPAIVRDRGDESTNSARLLELMRAAAAARVAPGRVTR